MEAVKEAVKEEREVAPIANTAAEWRDEMERMAQRKVPSFFHIRARLPKQGRTNQVLGASTHMNVVLKTYASGGENELHAHSNEDHVFVVLQGGASFFGPKNERRDVKKNDCVLVPAGAFYRFQADEGEPLVMLRIGAALDASSDVLARIDIDGKSFDGYSEQNKEVPIILEENKWFE
jgi:mannose-6-phosphate isomerase-like protein (cupin superfamily)